MSAQGEVRTQLQRDTCLPPDSSKGADSEARSSQFAAVASAPSRRYVWYVILLLASVNMFCYMDRVALSVLAPSIKEELGLSDGQLGLLIGFAFFLFYAIFGVPVARLADRGNRKKLISITLTIWSIMTALSGMAQNFWQLLAARVGLGAGEAGCIPAAQSIISDYVPLERRPGAYAVHTFGMSAGIMMGLVLASTLGESVGWRLTFVMLGVPGVVFAAVVALTLREPERGASDAAKDNQYRPSLRETVTTLLQCKSYRLAAAYLVVNGFASAGITQWWPSFFQRLFEVSSSSVGLQLGVAIGFGSGLGMIIGGIVSQRVAVGDATAPMIIGIAAISVALPLVLASLLVASFPLAILLACMAMLFWSAPLGPITAIIFSVTQSRMRATASAVTTVFVSVLGFGLGPFCVGVLSDALTPSVGVQALRYALLLPSCSLIGLIVLLFRLTKTLNGDVISAGIQRS